MCELMPKHKRLIKALEVSTSDVVVERNNILEWSGVNLIHTSKSIENKGQNKKTLIGKYNS